MRLFICIAMCFVLAGCTTSFTREQQLVRTHVVDACYTALEMSQDDRLERTGKYLQAYQSGGLLSEREVFVIKECLSRTAQSKKWKK